MKRVLFSFMLLLTGCASTTSPSLVSSEANYSDTMEIIRSAAASAPNGVDGEYVLKVQASGRDRSALYLNTELDYRDQRNITVSIKPKVARELFEKYNRDPRSENVLHR